ncbi:MAG: hypothetical protein IKR76_02140 [Ruminococcus sp.]|nr:hypothetical protein [Ruminococcus sp.]
MADMEKELERLFDTLNESELDELIGDITVEPDRQPDLDGLFDGKGHRKMKKNISRKSIALIAAAVAAIGITATAGAVAISSYSSADHDKAIQNAVGEDIESKDYYIGDEKPADNGHLKLTNETVLFDGEYGVLVLTIEPTDEIGEGIVNSSKYIDMPIQICDKDGMFKGCADGTGGSKLTNGCLVEYYAFNTYELTDEKLTAKGTINAVVSAEDEMKGMGQDISEFSFEFEKNTEPVTLKSDKGMTAHLSDFMIYIENECATNDITEPYTIHSDMTVSYKDGTSETLKNMEYVNGTLVTNDFTSDAGYCKTQKYGNATTKYFLRLIDSMNVESISFNGETFTAEQK